jgi:hypothetical protein
MSVRWRCDVGGANDHGVELTGADPPPRVRWFGCCLPVVLGALLVVVGAAASVARVVAWAW